MIGIGSMFQGTPSLPGEALKFFADKQAKDAANQAAYDARVQADRDQRRNVAWQREFAQQGVRWRVEDAKRAGIHPLAALGAQTASFSPVQVGAVQNSSESEWYSKMGQNVSRAISSTSLPSERQMQMDNLQLENASLQNDFLRTQVASSKLSLLNQAQTGPAFPSPTGQGHDLKGQGSVRVKPNEVTASQLGNPAQEAGAVNDYGFARTSKGLAVVPSSDVKNRIEDQLVPETMWAIRNQLVPIFSGHPAPSVSDYPLPKGARDRGADRWKWSPFHQEFRPHKGKYLIEY